MKKVKQMLPVALALLIGLLIGISLDPVRIMVLEKLFAVETYYGRVGNIMITPPTNRWHVRSEDGLIRASRIRGTADFVFGPTAKMDLAEETFGDDGLREKALLRLALPGEIVVYYHVSSENRRSFQMKGYVVVNNMVTQFSGVYSKNGREVAEVQRLISCIIEVI